jgi:hypothetical protein
LNQSARPRSANATSWARHRDARRTAAFVGRHSFPAFVPTGVGESFRPAHPGRFLSLGAVVAVRVLATRHLPVVLGCRRWHAHYDVAFENLVETHDSSPPSVLDRADENAAPRADHRMMSRSSQGKRRPATAGETPGGGRGHSPAGGRARGGGPLCCGGQDVDGAQPPVGCPGLPLAGHAPALPVGNVLGEQALPDLRHRREGGCGGARGGFHVSSIDRVAVDLEGIRGAARGSRGHVLAAGGNRGQAQSAAPSERLWGTRIARSERREGDPRARAERRTTRRS